MTVKNQVHSKFKLFAGQLGPNASLGPLAAEVAEFAARAKAAPKSIGVEYLESTKQVVVSLGYRDDEAPYPIKLQAVSLGQIDTLGPNELKGLEKKMEDAASKLPNVICHELLITEKREFVMVFMTHAG